MISAIVAVDENWGIGYNGDLLAHIPDDLKRFQQLTTNHVVIMGRKTWDSLPNKPLKNRLNLVISSQPRGVLEDMSMRISLEEAKIRLNHLDDDEEWFIIGGGEIYHEFLPQCDRVYVTKILKKFENVDTYFPNLDISPNWAPGMISGIYTYKDLSYQFWEYDSI